MKYELALPSADQWKGLTVMADVFVKSGLYKTRGADPRAEIATKVLMGAEFGLNPIQSLNEIHVIEGKPAPSAYLVSKLIDQHPDYRYEVLSEKTVAHPKTGEPVKVLIDRQKECLIRFWKREGGEWIDKGVQTWTEEMAKTANLLRKDNWRNYKADMLFNRCIASGARQLIPGVASTRMYLPDELDAGFDPDTGEELVVEATVVPPADAEVATGTQDDEGADW